jgi:hypothetical protein
LFFGISEFGDCVIWEFGICSLEFADPAIWILEFVLWNLNLAFPPSTFAPLRTLASPRETFLSSPAVLRISFDKL